LRCYIEEEKASYENLYAQEQRAAPRRIEELMDLVKAASAREKGLQEVYEARAAELTTLSGTA